MTSEPVIAYCVKCRAKRPIADALPVFLGADQRPATQGACPECGTKIVRFGATAAHQGLDPAEHAVESKALQERKVHGARMVIVESPAKARTVGRFLGRGYHVEASVGHIRDLPSNQMGVDVEHDFTPRYVIPARKKELVKKLRDQAAQASAVYLATDPDREGEAIAWHLRAALKQELRGIPTHRVEFHEITPQAVEHAFGHPRPIDERRVESQQARRILDRVVGFTLSPLLRDKLGRRGLSAGRVQSVALRLVCERERAIEAFVPVEYWSIEAELQKLARNTRNKVDERPFLARLIKVDGAPVDLTDQASAQAIVDRLADAEYAVDAVTRRERQRNPAPPFMTSTLQQEASRKLRFVAARTMAVAQALYEGKDVGGGERTGLITYMRTDSLTVAASAQQEARALIAERYGSAYLPQEPPQYKSRAKGAQEAHEAIRPTSVARHPDTLKEYLERDELRLYTLIWQRFVASQMAPAILDQTSVDIRADAPEQLAGDRPAAYLLRASGSVVKFPGFMSVYQQAREEDDQAEEGEGVRLPALVQGEPLDLLRLLPQQHFTQPPPRYSDASLIRALEEYGIGRPSTYAPTLQTLLARAYVARDQKKLLPTQLGLTVNDLLVEYFPDVLDVGFTAEMEENLDKIATGDAEWVPMLRDFYQPFAQKVEVARANMPELRFEPEPTGELCPQCGQPLLWRMGRFGKFVGCSGWPTCRYTQPIPLPDVVCPLCGGGVLERRTGRGRRFWGCANYQANDETSCQWTTWKEPKPESE